MKTATTTNSRYDDHQDGRSRGHDANLSGGRTRRITRCPGGAELRPDTWQGPVGFPGSRVERQALYVRQVVAHCLRAANRRELGSIPRAPSRCRSGAAAREGHVRLDVLHAAGARALACCAPPERFRLGGDSCRSVGGSRNPAGGHPSVGTADAECRPEAPSFSYARSPWPCVPRGARPDRRSGRRDASWRSRSRHRLLGQDRRSRQAERVERSEASDPHAHCVLPRRSPYGQCQRQARAGSAGSSITLRPLAARQSMRSACSAA